MIQRNVTFHVRVLGVIAVLLMALALGALWGRVADGVSGRTDAVRMTQTSATDGLPENLLADDGTCQWWALTPENTAEITTTCTWVAPGTTTACTWFADGRTRCDWLPH